MPIDPRRRRELASAANRLTASITISSQEPTETTVAHVRTALARHELLKIRVATDDRDECRLVAESLAEKAGCELVQVVGRVATLYLAKPADDDANA